jgi:SAM-dependent methyltransferase
VGGGDPWWVDDDYAQEIVADIRHAGLLCPLGGYARPREITIGADFRETIVYRGLSSRMRAVLLLLLDMPSTADVYAPESVTPFATTLRNRFAGFIGSEYLPTAESRAKNHSVRHEDAMALSFLDASFDAYVSCEVMEHIPSPQKALEEAARVLRQGGRFVATFPFGPVNETSVIKATLGPDGPVFIGEPEIHGNPVDGEGSPVFTIPGWDIIDMARKAGFSQADMIAVTSRRYGIVGSGPVPIFVMRAVR